MRLLYVCNDFGIPPAGTKGASIHLRAITRALSEMGHEVLLLSPRPGPGRAHPATRLLRGTRSNAQDCADQLRTWLRDRDLPVEIAADLRPLLHNAWVEKRAINALQKTPPDAVLERLSLFSHVGVDIADAFHCPFFVEVNALLTEEAERFRSLQLVDLARCIERRVLQQADGVFAVSGQLAELIATVGVDESRIHVVPNGADTERFSPSISGAAVRRQLQLRHRLVLGYAGSLKIWHGADVLVAAFQRLRRSHPLTALLIVGSGPTEQELRSIVRQADLDHCVRFTGSVEHDEMPRYLAAMDIAVAPYRAMDNFYFSPIKVFEYMAAGRCTVASRLGQIEEIIEHGRNGLLCPPDNPDALAEALEPVVADEARRTRLAAAARHTMQDRFTWHRAAGLVSAWIEDQITRRAGAVEGTPAGAVVA